MILISVLLGIALDRLWSQLQEYRQYQYFLAYFDWMQDRLHGGLWDRMVGLLLMMAPLWLAVALLQLWLSDWLLGLVGLAFYVAAFVYCLGPRDLAVDVDTWCELSTTGDAALRRRAAARLLAEDQVPDDVNECARELSVAALVEANDRMFAVIFWFVLLGPLGAVLYRSASVLYRQRYAHASLNEPIARLHAVLVWLPARLLALTYALSGHFDAAMSGWRQVHDEQPVGTRGSERLLAVAGAGALGESSADAGPDTPVRAAMRLVWRTLTIWLVVIAVLTLAGLAT